MRYRLALPFLALAAYGQPTFYKDVQPILQNRCEGCHRPGQIGPMAFTSYKESRPWAKAIKAAVATRKMPPWFADPAVGHFENDPRLSEAEIRKISEWADAGAPEGSAEDALPPKTYHEGWSIGKPDLILEVPKAFEVPAGGEVDYQWVVMPLGRSEDTWIQAMEYRPGDPSVVHHIIAFLRKPGSKWLADAPAGEYIAKPSSEGELGMSSGMLTPYVPGTAAVSFRPGEAMRIPAGFDIVLQIHYTPARTPRRDQSRVGFVFVKNPIEKEVKVVFIVPAKKLLIPPRDPNFMVAAQRKPEAQDFELLSLIPHMHLRGKAFKVWMDLPDGTSQEILNVPRYDFNWQLTYYIKGGLRIPEGAVMRAAGWFDNSANNPHNPDPDREVPGGDQTTDEMMVSYMFAAFPLANAASAPTATKYPPVE
jgi:hypothetical protein